MNNGYTTLEAHVRVQISTRTDDVTQEARDRATELMEKLQKFEPALLSADLVFSEEGRSQQVEAVLSIARSDRVHASGSGNGYTAAADDLFNKLSKILRRRHSQAKDRRVRTGAGEEQED